MIFPPKIVYVAGPISAPSKELRDANIEQGRLAGIAVWQLGAIALVPHLNSLTMYEDGHITGETVYLGDLELLGRCDAMLRLPNWENSRGTNYESAWAKHKNIPIFDKLEDLKLWLQAK